MGVTWDEESIQNGNTLYWYMVPRTDIQGIRKVKNFSLEFCMRSDEQLTFGWALVYWPGYWTQTGGQPLYPPVLATPEAAPSSLYEPNQHVIMQGIFNTTDAKQFRRFSGLARNLNSEDTVVLMIRVYAHNQDTGSSAAVTCRYAIAY